MAYIGVHKKSERISRIDRISSKVHKRLWKNNAAINLITKETNFGQVHVDTSNSKGL